MIKLFDWVKTHTLSTALLVVLLLLVVKQLVPKNPTYPLMRESAGVATDTMGIASPSMNAGFAKIGGYPSYQSPIPPAETLNRMVTKDTTLSLKVDDVPKSANQMEAVAVSAGGYLIDSNLSLPEGAASATISIRVPSEKRTEVLQTLRSQAVKVVSEYVSGQDVTDQYVDSAERLRIMESTKSKFEAILERATNVSEMLNVQRELLGIQSQIDSLKGQQRYLEGTTKLSRITLYLSTDELALPYAPDYSWRPSVIFKEAVRSLIMNVRQIGTLAIWVGVYAPVWVTVLIVLYVIKRRMK